jgi:hypothetical protein
VADIFASVTRYFHDRAWPYSTHDSLPILKVDYEGDNGRWVLYARAKDPEEQLIVLSVHPDSATEDRRPPMAEFLTRANFGLNIGNFEMDYEDGEVRFRTSIDVEGSALDDALIGTLVNANLSVMDDYFTGVADVAAGGSPAEVIRRVEEG